MDYRKRLQTIYAQAESEDRKKGEGIYYEEHHKIPAHYFANEQHPDGRNNPAANLPENKVLLTGKEHYMSHRLLYKIDPCPANLSALVMMQRIKRDGKIYTVKGREAAGKEITDEDEIDEEKIEDLAECWEGVMFAQMAAKIVELERAVASLKQQLDDKNSCC